MADLTHIFHVGQKVRVFVADDIWQKWHKTHEISRRMKKIRAVLCNLHKKQYGDL